MMCSERLLSHGCVAGTSDIVYVTGGDNTYYVCTIGSLDSMC